MKRSEYGFGVQVVRLRFKRKKQRRVVVKRMVAAKRM